MCELLPIDLKSAWSKSINDDVMVHHRLREFGYSSCFVPSLTMINRESADLASFFGWLKRQMFVGRHYFVGWPVVLAHGIVSTATILGAFVLAVVAAIMLNWTALAIVAGGLGLYIFLAAVLLVLMERTVRDLVSHRREDVRWFTVVAALKSLVAIPLSQFIYFGAMMGAHLMSTVCWRGLTYKVEGPWKIRLIEYRPYEAELSEVKAGGSLV